MSKRRGEGTKIDKLVEMAQRGDRRAFSDIVKREMESVIAITHRMTGERESALDLAQDTFVKAWEKIGEFRGDAKFSSWVHRIAVNKCLNHLSRQSRLKTESVSENIHSRNTASDPYSILEHKELQSRVLTFMGSLPPMQKVAFELRFYQHLTFAEIAETTGSALGTVKTNYRLALRKLRATVKDNGWI